MSKKRHSKQLSKEIVGMLAVSFVIAIFLLHVLSYVSVILSEKALEMKGIVLTELQYGQLDDWIFNLSLVVSVVFFLVLFLSLLGERLSYIHEILKGIKAMQRGEEGYVVPVEGSNELTQLAQAVNYFSVTQREVKEKERLLSEEKEQFIRALSHDIRTPLTSILSYSDILTKSSDIDVEEQKRYMALIQNKAVQIKELTDILLDGSKRNLEQFDDIRILMEQLVAEFEEMLEDEFQLETISNCPAVCGSFDVQEMRRIFDNLASNIQKYADPAKIVKLFVQVEDGKLVIRQENFIGKANEHVQSYQIGIRSIQRIAQNYDGRVDVYKDDEKFGIVITFSKI